MKIHILPTGFTPEVFTDSAGAIVKHGADRIISIHTRYRNKEEKEKVEATVRAMEQSLKTSIERRVIERGDIDSLIKSMVALLREFDPGDELFLHLVGGERHLCTALMYASLLAGRTSTLITATEYGFEKGKEFRFAYLPSVTPQEPTKAQKRILGVLSEEKGKSLSEIISSTGGNYASAAPSALRHLKNLIALNLARYGPKEKKYYSTALSKFFS